MTSIEKKLLKSYDFVTIIFYSPSIDLINRFPNISTNILSALMAFSHDHFKSLESNGNIP